MCNNGQLLSVLLVMILVRTSKRFLYVSTRTAYSFPILLNSDSFNKNANISPLHSIVDFSVYPLAKRASISFSIFLRLAPSCTVGSALLTIINGLSCQFVILYLLYTAAYSFICYWVQLAKNII